MRVAVLFAFALACCSSPAVAEELPVACGELARSTAADPSTRTREAGVSPTSLEARHIRRIVVLVRPRPARTAMACWQPKLSKPVISGLSGI